MSQAYEHILLERAEGVAHVVLNRPEKMNALGIGAGSSREEILRALRAADADPEVGCILLRANGDAFCAGGDLASAPATKSDRTAFDEHLFLQETSGFLAGVRATQKPIVCAVQGLCLGAAMGLVAQCDIVVAADDARFGLVEGRIGHPGASELVSIVGAAWAKFLILSGELIDAQRAERIGLVLTVLPAAQLRERTAELARRIARLPRESTVLNKACINQVAEASGNAAGRVAGRAHDTLTKTMSAFAKAPDGRLFADILRAEGVQGMKAARDSQFKGGWLPPAK